MVRICRSTTVVVIQASRVLVVEDSAALNICFAIAPHALRLSGTAMRSGNLPERRARGKLIVPLAR